MNERCQGMGNWGTPTPIGGFGYELTEYRTCRQTGSGSSGFGLISYGNPPDSSRLLMRAYIYLKINKMKLFMKIVKI